MNAAYDDSQDKCRRFESGSPEREIAQAGRGDGLTVEQGAVTNQQRAGSNAPAHVPLAATSKRYVVVLHVDTTSEPFQIAAIIADALDTCHVGPITVAPAGAFSWEDPHAE